MKIAIDSSPLESGHAVRGVGGYTRSLTQALLKEVKNGKTISVQSVNFYKSDLSKYDLIHYPYFDLFFKSLPKEYISKSIVTVHDVIPLIYPEAFPPGIRGKINFLVQKNTLQKAARIITVSNTSKKDVVRLLDIDPKKIDVIYEAPVLEKQKLDHSLQTKLVQKFKLPKKFVLYIGDVNYNKNLITLADACNKADETLAIVGRNAAKKNFDKHHIENQPLVKLLAKYGTNKKVIRTGYLADGELTALKSLATIYCQPSYYEGFGLPVLEAMQAGIPVLAAKTQALVEIAEGTAIFADPKNVNDFAKKISKLMNDRKLQKQLIKKGKSHVKKFSWDKAAKQTLASYKKALHSKEP